MTPYIFLVLGLIILYLAMTNKLYAMVQIIQADTRKVTAATNKR